MMPDLHWMTASELVAAYKAKSLSPVEVTEATLARADTLNPNLNALCLIDHEAARAAAQSSEARWQKGAPLGRLDGVPTAIKDLIITKGWPTLRGSKTVDPDQAWNEDAPCVARMREHGAIIFGKTTTPEFGWKGATDSALCGITRNPWDTDKTPGGSSGGASAAIAAGLCPIAIGTDGGGSIRIPAGFTGTFGLKPSYGRVPAFPLSPFGTVAHLGPMSRTVEDAALFLSVLAEGDARDWYAMTPDGRDYTAGLAGGIKGARIAYSPRLGFVKKIHPEVEALVAKAAQKFSALGAIVEEVDPPMGPSGDPSDTFQTMWWSGAYFALGDLPDDKKALLEPALRDVVEQGAKFTLHDYLSAVKARETLGSQMRRFMESYDFILTPTLAVPTFEVGLIAPKGYDARQWMDWTPFSYPFNLTQQPAASINCGFTKSGLPVGLQIVGRMHDDQSVLRAAHAFEKIEPASTTRPSI